MTSKIVFYIAVIITILCTCCSRRADAQPLADSVKWRMFLLATDSGAPGKSATCRIGFHTQAHYDLSTLDVLGGFTDRWLENFPQADTERVWPPAPPGLSIILQNIRGVLPGQTYQIAMLHPYTGPSLVDTIKVTWKSDNMTADIGQVLRWPPPSVLKQYADSIFLTDHKFGQYIKVDMTKDSNFVYRSSNYLDADLNLLVDPSIGQLRVVVYHPKPAPLPPDVVNSLSPANGATGVALNDSLRWSSIGYPSAMYRLQLATDRKFQNIIARDSSAKTAFSLSGKVVQNAWYYWRAIAFTPFGVGVYKSSPDSFKTILLPPGPPPLLFPTKGATNVANTPKFRWNAALYVPFGVPTYRVQVSSFSSFAPLLGDSTLTDTSVIFPVTFFNCDTIYWKVRATNASGTGPDSVSFFRVNFAVPGAPAATAPSDNALNVSALSLRLSWIGRDSCTDGFRIQITTDTSSATFTVNTTSPDTFYIAHNFQELTSYYWHVRAENSQKQSSYTSWRSFTTGLLPPGTPALVSPANAATLPGTSTTLVWNKAAGHPSFYKVEVDTASGFNSSLRLVDSSLTDTTKNIASLLGCTKYYWHVLAKNDSGSSAFSASQTFTVSTTPPDAPALISPVDNAVGQAELTQLSWSPRGLCPTTSYIVVLESLSVVLRRDTIAGVSLVEGPLAPNTQYVWRVTARNSAGSSGASTRTFKTTAVTRPPQPQLSQPPNGAGGISITPTLVWDSTARTKTWRVEVAYDTGFIQLVVKDSLLTVPSKQIGPLLNNTWFYWRVTAKNDSGYSPRSDVWKFFTLGPPIAPTQARPLNDQQDVPTLPTFTWSLPDGATGFQLQVSRDSAFTNFVYNDSTLTQTTWTLPQFLEGHKYYFWKVRARNSAGWGSFSSRWPFRTNYVGAASWLIPLALAETGPARDTIYFGIHPVATYGIDPGIGEFELPPPPPSGFFDCRFIDCPSRPGLLGEGTRVNFLPFKDYKQVDTFKVRFQPGVGTYPMMLSWAKSFIKDICDSMVITDEFGGFTVRRRMDIDSTVSVSNSALSTLLIIEYSAFPTGVHGKEGDETIPRGFALEQNYPNPFNPSTRIQFSTEYEAHIQLTVYDVLGNEVNRLVDDDYYPGVHSITWDGHSKHELQMPSGVYYVRMNAIARSAGNGGSMNFTTTRKMIMLK
ncbi:MAG: hypothetical protein HYR77_04565 [Ignavibacteria bacterium]|nr:hypothetical protein [Ignavibacteria bacterium]